MWSVNMSSHPIKIRTSCPTRCRILSRHRPTAWALWCRIGGDIELIKRLLAAGFPVVAEKGYYEYDYTGQLGWLGHYQFVNGYDDNQEVFIVQDTYVDGGQNFHISYEEFHRRLAII